MSSIYHREHHLSLRSSGCTLFYTLEETYLWPNGGRPVWSLPGSCVLPLQTSQTSPFLCQSNSWWEPNYRHVFWRPMKGWCWWKWKLGRWRVLWREEADNLKPFVCNKELGMRGWRRYRCRTCWEFLYDFIAVKFTWNMIMFM